MGGVTRQNIRGISASNTVFSSGTMRITGGPNITVGTDASGITMSAAAGGAGGGIALAGSNTTYTSGTVTLTGVANITVSSNTGQRIDLSVPAGATATGNLGGIIASNATITSGSVTLTGAGAATVTTAAGPTVQISVPTGASATGNLGSIAWSNTTVTGGGLTVTGSNAATVKSAAGPQMVIDVPVQTAQTGISSIAASNTTYTSGGITLTGSNMVTVKSTTGQGVVIDATQSVQTQNVVDVTLSGNTAGAMALVSSGTMTLAGGNNITLSQAGNAITISGAAAGGAQTGISSLGNSQTTYTSGQVQFLGSNALTVRSTTGQGFVFDAPTQTAQTGISSVAASNTTYTSGGITFTGSNAVTVRSTTGQGIVIDAPVQTAQTGISSIAASNTTYTSGGITITGSNSATVRSTTGQGIVIDVSQTVQTQNLHNVTMSGNTAGVMAHISSGTMTLAGGNNITLSQNGNAVTISGGAGGGFSAGVSTGGNTAGATGVTGTRMVLVGSANMTLSQTTDANGATVSFNAPSPSAAAYSVGVSTGGNTSGSTGVTGTRIVMAGGNNITLSQGTDATGATITVSAPNTTIQTYPTGDDFLRLPVLSVAAVAGNESIGTLFPLRADDKPFGMNLTATAVRMWMSVAGSSNRSAAGSTTVRMGLFTNNAGTLSVANSGSFSFGQAAASSNNSTAWNGMKFVDMVSSLWSAQPSFSADKEYYGFIQYNSAGQSNPVSIGGMPTITVNSGALGQSSFGTTTGGTWPIDWNGVFTATTNAIPASIQKSQVIVTGAGMGASPQVAILG